MTEQGRSSGELVGYTSEDGLAHVQLPAVDGSAWVTQAQLAEDRDSELDAKRNVEAFTVDQPDFAGSESLSRKEDEEQ
ncbi:hypothetical protein ACVWY0_003578 [Arthrobacter sp. UYNi723]